MVFHKEQVTTDTVTTREQAEQHLLGTYRLCYRKRTWLWDEGSLPDLFPFKVLR